MKKVLAVCLMMLVTLSVSVTAFAAPNGFVTSPSGNAAPIVIDLVPGNEDCTAKLVITPYVYKNTLSDKLLEMFNKAYDDILNAKDLTDLNADLKNLVNNNNLDSSMLAVSDLFDIHVTGCDYHEEHTDFDVTLSADTLKNFVGLLHMDKTGKWNLVADAEVINNGEHLKFSVDDFSPFAIIVDTSETVPDAPQTGHNSMVHVYAISMAVSGLAIVVVAVKIKKQRAR